MQRQYTHVLERVLNSGRPPEKMMSELLSDSDRAKVGMLNLITIDLIRALAYF
jgi:hypothetical protein